MGIGTYGRTFTLRNPTPCALGVAATGTGLPGPYTREAGALGYNEVHDTNTQTTQHSVKKLQVNHKKRQKQSNV
jgi:chitinase